MKFPLPEGRGLGAADMLLKGQGLTRAACLHTSPLVSRAYPDISPDPEAKKPLQPPAVSGTGCAQFYQVTVLGEGETFTTVFKKLNSYPSERL